MFDLNKLSEKELSYLFRESVKALKNKIPLLGTPTITGDYGRWLFANKNNYLQVTEPNREYDVVGDNNYIVKSIVVDTIVGNHRFSWRTRTNSHYYVFILFNEEYEVLKAIKMFFHVHTGNLVEVPINLIITINQGGEIIQPSMNNIQGFQNDYFHIDTIEDITQSVM